MTKDATTAVEELLDLAIATLPSMRQPSGLYCYDMPFDTRERRGESVRYSLMVLLGMQRAASAGLEGLADMDDLWLQCVARRESFTAGELGLAIWADSRRDGGSTDDLVSQLSDTLTSEEALSRLVGMEIAWALIGLAHARGGASTSLLGQLFEHLQQRRRASSGLYFHEAASRYRRHLPNFATQIYTVLALSTLARIGGLPEARHDAEALAEQLVRLQLPDGGWPWLFDAERAVVAERYEVYTVHQDAMVPMAFLDLSESTGNPTWARAAIAGLAWSRGRNELQTDLLDVQGRFAHRSIRRRVPLSRALLAANAVGTRTVGRPLVRGAIVAEVNRTCRPYHLGWILEAWAGRSDVPAALGA